MTRLKSLASLTAVFLVSFNFAAYADFLYTCECQDTGVECEGGERLDVRLSGKKAVVKYGERDGRDMTQFNVVLNPNYVPRTLANQAYQKYTILSSNTKDYQIDKSSFLIDKKMAQGKRNGSVKFQSVQAENTGGGFYTWEFECSIQSNGSTR